MPRIPHARTRLVLLLLAALSLALAAGCGGDEGLSKADYEQEVRSAGDRLESAFTKLAESGQGAAGQGSVDEVTGTIKEAQDELRASADDLDGIDPPEDVQQEHARLVGGLRALADDLDELRKAIDERDLAGVRSFLERVPELEAVTTIQEATRAIREKGYDIGAA
jgi:hypothetical protein